MISKREMEKQHLQWKKSERECLEKLLEKGTRRAKVLKRAPALLEWDRGRTWEAVAATVTVPRLSVRRGRDRCRRQGWPSLEEAPRSGRPNQDAWDTASQDDGAGRQRSPSGLCTAAPATAGGESGGTRLGGQHLPHAGKKRLKKNERKPRRKKAWCLGQSNAPFIAPGERSLWCRRSRMIRSIPWCVLMSAPAFSAGRRWRPWPCKAGRFAKSLPPSRLLKKAI
jgi:hypothetical protein